MKKYVKYLTTFLLMFTALISSVSAVTIKETLIEGDGYSTIEDGSIVIGITKFSSDTVVTGGRATKAGSDAALMYIKLNGNADGFETPVIYVYAGGGWFALDKDNNASVVEDQAILDDLSNKDIYYVNDDEKLLDIDVSGINIDTSKLPKGVTYENGKLWVKATKDSVTVVDKDGAEYKYVKERGLFTLDKSECYQVNGNEITGYSNTCSKNVIIPSKVGDTEIVSVGADAFRNKGIKTVVIPKHIISLKDNAFADNSLESVTIEDKYDETDFDVYGQNVFGSFKDEDILWKNDLTALLSRFDDEVTIKVSNTFNEYEFEYEEEKMHVYLSFVKQQQTDKLGLTLDKYSRINGKYNIEYGLTETKNKIVMTINDGEEGHAVYKEVSYEVVTVSENNDDYLNIKEDYEEYFETVKTKMKNKDFSIKLTGIDGLIDIADEYNYELITVANGYGSGPLNYNNEPDKANRYLIYNGALHYVYEEAPYYNSIFYPVTIDGKLEETDEIFAAMKEIFEEETNIAKYDVNYDDNFGSADKYEYVIELETEETNEIYVLYYSKIPERGKLYLNYENEYGNSYTYYPSKTLEDWDGNVIMYFDYAFNELNEKYNTGMDYELSGWIDSSEELNSDELYDATYSASIYVYGDNNKVDNYTVKVNNPKSTKSTDKYVESFVEFDNNKTEEEYEQDVLNKFFEKKDLEHYYTFENVYYYVYDEELNEYREYNGMYIDEGKEIFQGIYIFDFDTNIRYIALFRDFYDRDPGTLFITSTEIGENVTSNYYKYIPTSEYKSGKFSDYIETVKKELKTKAQYSDNASISFNFYDSNTHSSGYKTTYVIDITDSIEVEGKQVVNSYTIADLSHNSSKMFEMEYFYKSDIEQGNNYSLEDYEETMIKDYAVKNNVTDYYYTNLIYSFVLKENNYYWYNPENDSYEDILYGYMLYDFDNNRRVYIINEAYKEKGYFEPLSETQYQYHTYSVLTDNISEFVDRNIKEMQGLLNTQQSPNVYYNSIPTVPNENGLYVYSLAIEFWVQDENEVVNCYGAYIEFESDKKYEEKEYSNENIKRQDYDDWDKYKNAYIDAVINDKNISDYYYPETYSNIKIDGVEYLVAKIFDFDEQIIYMITLEKK